MTDQLIWDFDGTLFDTYPATAAALERALGACGIVEPAEKIRRQLAVSEGHALAYYRRTYALNDLFSMRYAAEKQAISPGDVPPFPFAKEVCAAAVQAGGRNFIVTHRGSSTFAFLAYYGLSPYVTEAVTKENGFPRKPDPAAYRYLLEKYRIPPERALVIGDREMEIRGGKAAGIRTCLFNTNRIVPFPAPDQCVDSLREMLPLFSAPV